MAQTTKHTTRLLGVREAKAAFKALDPEVRKVYAAVVRDGVALVAERARSAVRRDTGSLADAITTSAGRTTGWGFVRIAKKSRRVFAGRGGSALTSKGAFVREPRRYGHLVEFGTSRLPARPFMRRALEEGRPAIEAASVRAGETVERVMAARAVEVSA